MNYITYTSEERLTDTITIAVEGVIYNVHMHYYKSIDWYEVPCSDVDWCEHVHIPVDAEDVEIETIHRPRQRTKYGRMFYAPADVTEDYDKDDYIFRKHCADYVNAKNFHKPDWNFTAANYLTSLPWYICFPKSILAVFVLAFSHNIAVLSISYSGFFWFHI